jgi:hypothetical protein
MLTGGLMGGLGGYGVQNYLLPWLSQSATPTPGSDAAVAAAGNEAAKVVPQTPGPQGKPQAVPNPSVGMKVDPAMQVQMNQAAKVEPRAASTPTPGKQRVSPQRPQPRRRLVRQPQQEPPMTRAISGMVP